LEAFAVIVLYVHTLLAEVESLSMPGPGLAYMSLYFFFLWAFPSPLALRAIVHDAGYSEPLAFDAASMQKC